MDNDSFVSDVAQPVINCLENAVHALSVSIGKADLINDPNLPRFRYSHLTIQHVCLLRSVRIVSALNALLVLWQKGFVQEMGVLYRTIAEFLNDIMFMLEEYPSATLTPNQQRFIDVFSKEEFEDSSSAILKSVSRNTVPRNKIRSAVSRMLSNGVNPHDLHEILTTEESSFAGYIHGAYPHIMELYGGDSPKFHMNGMLDTPRIDESRKQIEIYLDRSICLLGHMCFLFKLNDSFVQIDERRKVLEKQIGVDRSISPDEKLSRLKKSKAK